MSQKRLLLVLAHPDDEAFGSGGLIAKLVEEGVEVYYICATKGDRGTVAPEYLERFGSVEAAREAELDCASRVLGFKQVFKLGYSDSGMMGSPDNHHPECLWQADEGVVAGQIVGIMRQIQPQVVLTFDSYGGYGHPDHIYIHRATTRAFLAAGDASQYPDHGAPYAPQKLYYTVFPKRLISYFILMTRLRGKDPRALGVNKDLDLIAIRDNAAHSHTAINVRRWLKKWDEASACHASQNSMRGMVPLWLRSLVFNHQRFYRRYPEFGNGERTERDLFAGVK